MAISEVAVCNSALAKIGADRIVSLTEDSRVGRLCNEQYLKVIKALLREHPWNFAYTRVSLAASVTTPDFGFDYKYPIPTDFIRALHVNDDEFEWRKEGDYILTDETTCELEYIANVSCGLFDAAFDELAAIKLAHDLCGDLTTSPTLKKDLFEQYKDYLRAVRLFDAQEGFVNRVRTTTFVNSRR